MNRTLRLACLAVIVALAAGWAGLHAQNASLEAAASSPQQAVKSP